MLDQSKKYRKVMSCNPLSTYSSSFIIIRYLQVRKYIVHITNAFSNKDIIKYSAGSKPNITNLKPLQTYNSNPSSFAKKTQLWTHLNLSKKTESCFEIRHWLNLYIIHQWKKAKQGIFEDHNSHFSTYIYWWFDGMCTYALFCERVRKGCIVLTKG